MTVADQVGNASTLIGLLLVLVTLFTSVQSTALQVEKARSGGPHAGAWRRIASLASALAAVTIASMITLVPTVRAVINTTGKAEGQPLFAVFVLVWLLLVPLCVWQITIAVSAIRTLR